ncbi:LysR family transcriptional regulator [Roseibium litorale]|uniref:LysR family transcriptional regulator n=1 Tax=Roseibium litorale TaxID=2803841 RepID=A0ABR9CKE2_9HYPH|nr:LysR family transcriptional regulator [Roseibium litorale]MBD8891044.1 LysR family transcriptional regulator [Roseibium litorale]
MADRPRSRLTLAQLQALNAVVETSSFSLAAKALGIAQPSVSNHIQALENRFKARLIVRDGHSARPSPALSALLPRIRALLSLANDLEAELLDQSQGSKGQLRIGYSAFQLAIPQISAFMNDYPGISIEALSAASADLLIMLEAGKIDVAFITARALPTGLSGLKLCATKVVLAVPTDHDLALQPFLDWKTVAGLPLIQREKSSGTRQIFEAAATVAGVEPETILSLGSWESICAMIASGLGFGVVLDVELSPADPFKGIPIPDSNLAAAHYAVCLPDMAKVAAVEAFLSHLPRAES